MIILPVQLHRTKVWTESAFQSFVRTAMTMLELNGQYGELEESLCLFVSPLLSEKSDIEKGVSHPANELEYFIKDSDSTLTICDQEFEKVLSPLSKQLKLPCIKMDDQYSTSDPKQSYTTYNLDSSSPAMIIYTR